MRTIINLIFAFSLLAISSSLRAQTVYNMGAITGTTINTCSGTFVDAGGVAGNYGNNQNHTVTFCSGGGASPTHIQLDFSRIELGDDNICFYDGPTTAAPQIFCLGPGSGQSLPGGPFLVRASAVNPSGCITITFTSGASVTDNGWTAAISCVASCQTIYSELVSSTPAVVPSPNGYIDICQGQTVSFSGRGLYPQNGFAYNHSDATSTFEWNFGDGQTAVGLNVTHAYPTTGGFFVQLSILDQLNCPNINRIAQRVRVAGKPRFTGTGSSLGQPICAGDTTPINAVVGNAISLGGTFEPPIFSGDSLFLPDGTGTSYPTTINVQAFAPGQTLTSIAGLQGICMNLEHSFMSDLSITLRCPNNTTITLHNRGGGGRFLGTPCDVDAQAQVRGTVAAYCFTTTATTTWLNGPTVNVTDPCTGTVSPSLAAGNYLPDNGTGAAAPNPLNALVGCPLNGPWILTMTDNAAIDNGYISSWTIDFAASLFPAIESFTPTIIAQNWLPDPAIITSIGQNISVSPTCAGVRSFTYSVTNNFGCSYDTTVTLTVRPRNHPACRTCNGFAIQDIPNAAVCTNTPVVLAAPTTGGWGQITSCFTNNTGQAVLNQSTATPISSPIVVTNVVPAVVAAGVINEICINFSHGYDADLDIYLVAPNGTQIELSTDNGGSGDNYGTATNGVASQFTCFRPNATLAIGGLGAGSAPFINPAGYLPEGAIANFNGANTNGTWTLKASDDSGGAAGRLNEWYMSFNNQYNVTYNWARNPVTGTLVTATNGATATVTPITTTTYTVTATDSYGCTDTETAVITVGATLPAPVVVCDAVTMTSVTVRWNDVIGATSYTITATAPGVVGVITNIAGVNYVTITGLPSNIPCTVTVLPVGNCPAVSGFDTCTPGGCTLAVNNPTTTPVSCFGGANGTVTITRINGVPSFSYEVSTVPLTTIATNTTGLFSGLVAGNYGVTVTDNGGCTASNTFTITQPIALVVTATTTQATCNNGATGTATATAVGGVAPYTYRWNTTPVQQVTMTATGLVSNVYIVTVTDARGCTETAIANVTEPTQMALTMSMTEPLCNNQSGGSATVLVAGGLAPYGFRWSTSPNQFGQTATNIPAGTYTVTVTDANVCSTISSVIVTQPSAVDGQVTIPILPIDGHITCFGGTNGQLDANFTGGNPPYIYNWQGGALGISRNNLPAGTYTVTATDQNGCRGTATGTITQPAQLVATATQTTPVTCFGLSNGVANVVVTGGIAPYVYAWSPSATGAFGNNPSTLPAGTHTVTVTDFNLCTTQTTVTITQPIVLDVVATPQAAVTCFGGNNGGATTVVTGGNGGFGYNWDNGFSTSPNPNNLTAGIHTVVVTDSKNCASTTNVTIVQPTLLTATAMMTDSVSCRNGNDGKATVTPLDGTPPYTYQWNSPLYIGQSPINFPAGTFTVIVTDNNNCTTSATVVILQPLLLAATATVIDSVTCRTFADGSAEVTLVTGGTLNYHYDWGGGITTPRNDMLPAGTHTVTITDNNMCSITASVNILQPFALTAQALQASGVNCFGGNDGVAIVNVTGGGTPPFRFNWDNGFSLLQNPSNLNAGTHTVLVTDYHNCTFVTSVTITEPTVFSVSAIETTRISCNLGSDGTATATPLGGVLPYSFIWDNIPGNNNNLGTGFNAGTHTVVVTDGNNCVTTTTVTITQPLPLTATTTFISNVTCIGRSDGAAIVNASNGNPTYTYFWDSNNAQQQANNLTEGPHTVLVTDIKNCTTIATVTIGAPPALTIQVAEVNPVTCFGRIDGQALATPAGGTPGYTYIWDIGGSISNQNNTLAAGGHTVRVTDANGCSIIGTVTIAEPQILLATALQSAGVSCNGFADGSAFATTTGGNLPYSYGWDSPSALNPATNLTAGLHTVRVTDAKLCTTTASVNITQPNALAVNVAQITQVKCFGGSDALASANVTGGTVNFTYLWDNTNPSATPNDLNAGSHTVLVTDGRGCTVIGTVLITQPIVLTATTTSTNVSCFAGRNGTASVTPAGGNPPYFYAWNSVPAQATPFASLLPAGTFTVTVSDANGCNTNVSATVTEPTELILSTSNIINVQCYNQLNGSATANVTGGTGGIGFAWSDTNHQQTATMNAVGDGTYFVTATDANSCTKIASAVITEPTQLLAVATSTNLRCNGIADGTVTATPTGGTPPYNTVWNTPAGATIGLPVGTYTVTVTDANNCTVIASANVLQPPSILPNIPQVTVVEPKCFGALTGSAIAEAQGGASSLYTYLWSTIPVQNINQATQLSAGTYTVTVTDINGCSASTSVTLGQPNDLVLTMTQGTVKCFGTPTGTATVTVGGGTPGYTYIWNNGKTDSNPNFLVAGVYTVTVTDRFNCSRTATIEVIQPQLIDIQMAATPTRCNGGSTGTITATVSGGTVVSGGLGYQYTWQDVNGPIAQSTGTVANMGYGTYTVMVADANGCTNSASVEVTTQTQLALTVAVNNQIKCFEDNNGSATVTATGGISPYSYAWNSLIGAQPNPTAADLAAGTYVVTVTDVNNCSGTIDVTITQPNRLRIDAILPTHVSCKGGNNGIAWCSPLGGTQPYSYDWGGTPPVLSQTLTNLSIGNYSVIVTDANLCSVRGTVTITEPETTITASAISTEAGCQNTPTGTATATVFGGTVSGSASYTYLWSSTPTQLSAVATGLPIGVYTVTATDLNGCSATASASVLQPSGLSVHFDTNVPPHCRGGRDGSASAFASGGTPNYTYAWNTTPAQIGITASGMTGSQTYIVTASDVHGCTGTGTITISEPAPLLLYIETSPSGCFGAGTGTAYVQPNGGTPSYTYNWSDSSFPTTQSQIGLTAGIYNVTVTDFYGCSTSSSLTIAQSDPMELIMKNLGNVGCHGESTGTVLAKVTGGALPRNYTYAWAPNTATTALVNNLAVGTYSVTVTDSKLCTIVGSITISEPDLLQLSAVPNAAKCYASHDGQIQLQITGGQSPYVYSYDGGATYGGNPNLVGVRSGNYALSVRDANGCIANSTTFIDEPAELRVDAGPDKEIEYEDLVHFTANASATVSYVWTSTPHDTSVVVANTAVLHGQPLADTYYKVVATDINGCVAEDKLFVRVKSIRRIFVANAITPNNDNINDVLFVQGGRGAERVNYFKVFDRWGELIFETADTPINDKKSGWNATYKGQAVDPGVYVWFAEVRYSDGQVEVLKGSVDILK
jgi:large repetitive protein